MVVWFLKAVTKVYLLSISNSRNEIQAPTCRDGTSQT
jgi:hypothetical protein